MYTANPNIPTIPRSQVFLPSNEDFILFFDTENTLHLTGAKNVSNVLTFTDYETGGGGGGINLVNNSGTDGLVQVSTINPNVSSGNYSITLGSSNNELGNNNIISGNINTISGVDNSGVIGGNNNTVADSNSAIIAGNNNTVSNINSAVIGGNHNRIQNINSGILAGQNGYITTQYSAIIGGVDNTVSAVNSVILGGSSQTEILPNTVQVPNLRVNKQLLLKQGTNQISGQVTLSGGTVTLGNSLLSATAKVFFSVVGASANQGFLHYVYSAPGFNPQIVITSSNSADTSVLNYLIIDAA